MIHVPVISNYRKELGMTVDRFGSDMLSYDGRISARQFWY